MAGGPSDALTDPVVAIIEAAGHRADPRVAECGAWAAEGHAQRLRERMADGPAVNRSTYLWALATVDAPVRTALEQSGIRLEALQSLLGIRGGQTPVAAPYQLAVELDRALRTFVENPRKLQLTLTPWSLAVAVLEDVVTHGGRLGERLSSLGADADVVLAALRRVLVEGRARVHDSDSDDDDDGDGGGGSDGPGLPRMRDISASEFGVLLPPGATVAGPYVARDVDVEVRRQLRERLSVVAVVAQPGSGAIRTVFEALRRERGDDRVLMLHRLVETGADPSVDLEELDRLLAAGVDVVWIRFLGELVRRDPVVKEWLSARRDAIAATRVLIVRPEDAALAVELGLAPANRVELSVELSAPEQARAEALYDGSVSAASGLAGATLRHQGAMRANYAADSAAAGLVDKDSDALDVRGDVDMLAKLIASRDVAPPLSIGLFGPWGSGKSFLMRQVQLRIKDLADRSRVVPEAGVASGSRASGYLTEVIPVEFNAWQYAHGTALWAALINKVFEQVRVELTQQNRYEEVMQQLADKDLAVVKARVQLDTALQKVNAALPAAEDRPVEEVVKKHRDISDEQAQQVESGMKLSVATTQISELKDEYDRLKPVAAQVAHGWSTASRARKAFVIACVVVVVALGVLVLVKPEWMAALLGAVIAILGAVIPVIGPVRQGLDQARKILRADARDKAALRRAEEDLARATADMQAAKVSGLAGLYGFVSDRSTAAEYLAPLGMGPMIRDDLERLAELARGADGIPGIDRIVIYIDDLDRCPASQVVQVLEAVNLLFGFELFVVVVAVDSRWLLRSLTTEFSEAFDAKDSAAPTPQNYLEKIIQIPFWVQPMQPAGFGRLVTNLAGEVTQSVATPGVGGAGVPAADDGSDRVPVVVGHGEPDETPVDGGSGPAAAGVGGGGDGGVVVDVGPAETVDTSAEDLNPEALRLTSDERDCMTRFLPLVGTPRAVKRFINTYQLLRITVGDVDGFLAAKEYEPVLLLLALVTGTVPMTDTMVAELAVMTEADFGEFLGAAVQRDASTVPPRGDWRIVQDACSTLATGTLTPGLIATWLPTVARYSFHHVEW